MKRARAAATVAMIVAAAVSVSPSAMSAAAVPGEALFAGEGIPQFHIRIAPDELDGLRRTNRTYVRATVEVGTRQLRDAGVRLKGHGSFQPLDAKPSLTVKFDEFVPGQNLDGLTKILLNNSGQDTTYLSEYIAAGMFQDAGVPVARVAHARVRLNSRDLGFYVLAEGMNKVFLKRHFGDAKGNLYDVNAKDIDERLIQSNGPPGDQSDVAALVAAARLPPGQCARALPEVLDLDRFLSFLAVSILGAHHDSYPLNRNNYRLYRDPVSRRFVMMPHGIDGSFSRVGMSIRLPEKYVLTKAVARTPEFEKAFRERVAVLFTNILAPEWLTNRIHAAVRRLQNAAVNDAERAGIAMRAGGFARRVIERHRNVEAQLAGVDVTPVKLGPDGTLQLTNWNSELNRGTAAFDIVGTEGRRALHIHTGAGDNLASWRQRMLIAPGSYRVRASVRFARDGDEPANAATGLALRISGRPVPVRNPSAGVWTPLEFRFAIGDGEEDVQFVCECRGGNAQAWFDLDSIVLHRE